MDWFKKKAKRFCNLFGTIYCGICCVNILIVFNRINPLFDLFETGKT